MTPAAAASLECRLSVLCACTVPNLLYPEQRLLVPRCADQLKVDRTLVLEYYTTVTPGRFSVHSITVSTEVLS
jgi:hypothetical protein